MEKEVNISTATEIDKGSIEPKVKMQEQMLFPVRISSIDDYGPLKNHRTLFATKQGGRFIVDHYNLKSERTGDIFETTAHWDKKRNNFAYETTDYYDLRLIKMPNGRKFVHKRTHMGRARALAYGEILYGNIAKQLDVPCVKYHPVMDRSAKASESNMTVMSEFCYNPKTEKLIDVKELHNMVYDEYLSYQSSYPLATVLNMVDELHKQKCKLDGHYINIQMGSDTKLRLFQMYVVDYITMQGDRRLGNINFIVNKKTGQARLAPLLDNGWIENLMTTDVMRQEEMYDSYGSSYDSFKAKLLTEKQICYNLKWEMGIKFASDLPGFESDEVEEVKQNCEGIVKLSTAIPGATYFLTTIPEKLNPIKAIEDTNNEIGFELPNIEKQNVINTANIATDFISQSLTSEKYRDAVASVTLSPILEKPKQTLSRPRQF